MKKYMLFLSLFSLSLFLVCCSQEIDEKGKVLARINDYNLMPLDELEESIKKNKHLPGLPSAKNVEANGIMVGEMTQTLTQKVEELTLYIIELNKKVEKLEKENQSLKDK